MTTTKTKKGQFKSLEEAVKFKNDHLMKILKNVDLKQVNKPQKTAAVAGS
jgi:hypothetical protein